LSVTGATPAKIAKPQHSRASRKENGWEAAPIGDLRDWELPLTWEYVAPDPVLALIFPATQLLGKLGYRTESGTTKANI
jgi:hypothetical protein